MPNKPTVFSYLRVSTENQRDSLNCTEQQARALAAKLVADGSCVMGEIVQEAESAVEVRWNERPGFVKLMRLMEPGDRLIIEAKDRLERDDVEMLVCLRWLERRKITLHCLMSGGRAIDLGDECEQIKSHFDAIVASQYARMLKARTREALRFRRENGFCAGWDTPPGKKKVKLELYPGQKTNSYKTFVWDEQQCAILREIVQLRDVEGWTFEQIGALLRERGDRNQFGGQWTKRYYDPKRRCHRLHTGKLRQAYDYVKALRATGVDAGGGPFIPSTVAFLAPAKPPSEPKPPRPPPKPRGPWRGKPWMHALLAKWAAKKNGASSSVACPSTSPPEP
jgi:DNA invertase Pin-like site-specific DNA recombinase